MQLSGFLQLFSVDGKLLAEGVVHNDVLVPGPADVNRDSIDCRKVEQLSVGEMGEMWGSLLRIDKPVCHCVQDITAVNMWDAPGVLADIVNSVVQVHEFSGRILRFRQPAFHGAQQVVDSYCRAYAFRRSADGDTWDGAAAGGDDFVGPDFIVGPVLFGDSFFDFFY